MTDPKPFVVTTSAGSFPVRSMGDLMTGVVDRLKAAHRMPTSKDAEAAAHDWIDGKVESIGEGVERVGKRKAKRGEQLAKKVAGTAYACTELGLAERFVAQHSQDVCYCGPLGWLVWDGTRWRVDDTGEVTRRMIATVRSIFNEAADEKDHAIVERLCSFALASEKARVIASALKLAETNQEIVTRVSVFDSDQWLFNTKTATINLKTGEAKRHDRSDLITKISPVVCDVSAGCPLWLAFLEKIFAGNKELGVFVQKLCGYALSGSVSEQILAFFHGLGANGKSTFLSTLLAVFGEYGRQAAPDLLLSKRGDMSAGDASAIADLHGARLVVCTEIGEGRAFDEVGIKQITGGDRIKCKRMRENWWEFDPTHKVVVAANHRPAIRGTDHAIWRRIRLVPFNVTITDAEKDPDLPAKLREELPGILGWCVEGCLAWQRDGLQPPDAVVTATAAYRADEDVLAPFLTERCVLHERAKVSRSRLYGEYIEWCQLNGERAPVSDKTFAGQLRDRGIKDIPSMREQGRATPTRGWSGIGLVVSSHHVDT